MSKKIAAPVFFQSLEQRIMLSATQVMGFIADFQIFNQNGTNSEFVENTDGTIKTDNVDWNHFTQVDFYDILPQPNSGGTGFVVGTYSSSVTYVPVTTLLQHLVPEANSHGVPVYVTLGGGDTTVSLPAMNALLGATQAQIQSFAADLHQFCTTAGLAGVDIDYEPLNATTAQITNLGYLIQQIHATGLNVTADTLPQYNDIGNADTNPPSGYIFPFNATALNNLSAINVEEYTDGTFGYKYMGASGVDDTFIEQWATQVGAANVGKIQYGIGPYNNSVSPDSSNYLSSVDDAVATTLSQGYGGLFIWTITGETSTTGNPTAGYAAEIAAKLPTDVINGTAGVDHITLTRNTDNTHIDWAFGGTSGQVLINDPIGLTINGAGSNDVITLSGTHGNPLPDVLHLNGTFTITGLPSLASKKIDIGKSTVYFSYAGATDNLSTIRQYLANAFNNGNWNGVSSAGLITSLNAAGDSAHATSIGYADSADGRNVDTISNSIELRYTYKGDTNLDGSVNFSDLVTLAQSYNNTSASWDQGDFDYNANVNFSDLVGLAQNYNKLIPPTVTIAAAPAARVHHLNKRG